MKLALVLVHVFVLGSFSQALPDSVVEARTKAIASQLRCPVCQGLSIQDSPTELAQSMRNVIKSQVQAGKSDKEIIDYFVEKYDEWILLQPKARGVNLLVYLLPIVLLMGGLGFVMHLSRKWSHGSRTVVTEDVDL